MLNAPMPATEALMAKSDYAANGGSYFPRTEEFGWADNIAKTSSAADIAKYIDHPNTPAKWPDVRNCDGAFCFASSRKLKEFIDGLSNTYLVGEKYLNPDQYETGADLGDNETLFVGYDWDTVRWGLAPVDGIGGKLPLQDRPGLLEYHSFGSAHPGGFMMSMADGSVKSMAFDVDPVIHERYASRRDGEVINDSTH